MKKTPRGKSQLDKIRSAIKIRRNEQKEKEKYFIGKHIKKAKSLSPLNNHEKSDSFDILNYMDNRFNNIDDNIKEVKTDIKEMKDTMYQMEFNSRISMIMTGMNKGLLANEYEVRKKIGKYINRVYKSTYKDLPFNNEEKYNMRNKNSSSTNIKLNANLPENLINLNKSTNKLNIPKKRYSNFEKRINLKKDKAHINKSLSVTLGSHSHRQSIKSAYSINNKIINLKKKKFEAEKFSKIQYKNNLFNNFQKEEPKIPANKNINFNNFFNKKNKNQSYIYDYSQQQNSSSSSKSHQIKPNYSIDTNSSKKNGKK